MVADRAGASIGTVYRYFPDRIAVLQSVASRAVDRFADRISETFESSTHSTWWEAIDALIDGGIDAFRNEPAFAALRFGDVLDLRPREDDQTGSSIVASHVAPILVSRYGIAGGNTLAFHLEVTFSLVDGLLARAFAFDSKGDERFITEARTVAKNYLVGVFGEV